MPAAKKSVEETAPDPLAFSNSVNAWMDEASAKVDEFREQVGTPSLGIDAHMLDYLTRIGVLLDAARADLHK